MTCLAHATTAAHELIRSPLGELSPEYLHYFASSPVPSAAASFEDTARALQVQGQPLEKHCPYRLTEPPPGWQPPNPPDVFKRSSELKFMSIADVGGILITGAAPVLGISLPEAFFDPKPPWVISPDGPVRALHAVLAVALGLIGSSSYVLVRNSWGSDWADRGHAWLDDRFLDRHLKQALVLTGGVQP